MNLLNKLTLKNLKLNKKRTIVTIIGIILSVALISAVTAMFFSFRDSMIKFETREKGNYHYAFNDVQKSDIKYFKENRNFEKIFYTKNIGYSKNDNIKNDYKPYLFIKAFDDAALNNLSIKLVSGALPKNDNEILIPTHLKTNGRVEYKIGDTLTLEVGRRISTEDNLELGQNNPYNGEVDAEKIIDTVTKEYKVVGIIERPSSAIEGYEAPGYTLVTKLTDIENADKLDIYTRYTKDALKDEYNVTADILSVDREAFNYLYNYNEKHSYSDEETKKQIEKLGEPKYSYNKNSYLILLETGIFKDNTMKSLGTVVAVVIGIIIFTSVFCIKNSFNISITEKIKQYGMLSTVGATSKQIKHNVYYEALILGLFGVPLGILSGLLASYILIIISNLLIKDMINIELVYSFSWLGIIFASILGFITLYLSAWGSAHKASKISPITAIRNSENIKINSKKVKSPKYIKKIFGIGGDVSYKNLKRNKKKYRATVISIIVCVSIFIALSAFINLAFDEVQREIETTDYNVALSYNLNDEVSKKAQEVLTFDNIKNYSVIAQESLYEKNINFHFSQDYLKYFPDIQKTYHYTDQDGVERTEYGETYISIYRVGSHAYEEYLKLLNLKEENVKNKGILYNIANEWVTVGNKSEPKNINMFDYKKGDIISLIRDTEELDKDSKKPIVEKIDIEIASTTNKLPFGMVRPYNPILIVSDDYFNTIFKDFNSKGYEEIVIDSTNASKLQDQIEEYLKDYDNEYSLVNTEESVKMIRSLYTLVAIFLYGFITVIALIGITNIFNTITTNMELRSREFATLKSIGMTRKEFNRMIRLESFFYGTKSLIIGIPIGCLLSYLIHHLLMGDNNTVPFKLPLTAIIISILAVFILITCIMKYSINKINKQNTIETIRNENI